MRSSILIFIIIISIALFSFGCTSTETPTNQSARNTANSNATAANSNNPLGTTKTPEATTTNNAPTLTPIVQGYYAALQKKDEAAVKKFLSQAAIKYNEGAMKEEKKTSLLALLEENESPIEEKRELRNEKIEGDTATAEMKGGSLGVWTPIKFVKENGEWKFASPEDSFGLQDIGKSSSNSNAAK
jgi:hypothetical protein